MLRRYISDNNLWRTTSQLLAGTLRENLDPFSQYDDATLNSALQSAGLWDLSSCRVTSSTDLSASLSSTTLDNESHHRQGSTENVTLDTNIEAGGLNFSLGQRCSCQLMAKVRTILNVVLIDKSWLLLVRSFEKVKYFYLMKVSACY